jgi:hypothetical protein
MFYGAGELFLAVCVVLVLSGPRVVRALSTLALAAMVLVGCGTLTGAAVGAGSGAAIGAGTGYGAGKGALVGTGVGAAAGAIYDIVQHERDDD